MNKPRRENSDENKGRTTPMTIRICDHVLSLFSSLNNHEHRQRHVLPHDSDVSLICFPIYYNLY